MLKQDEGLMRSLAEELQQEREHKGISLNNIAESTKINIRFLKAIEQADFDCIEAPYMKMFLKAYAQEIGLDPVPILEHYEKIKGSQEEEPASKQQPVPSKATEEPAAPPMSNRSIGFLAVGLVVLIIVGVKLFGPSETEESSVPESTVTDISRGYETATPASVLLESTATEAKPAFQSAEDERMVSQEATTDSLILEGTARMDTWVEVRTDDTPVFTGVMKEGRSLTWIAKDTLLLTLGKPMGIGLILNGEPISANWPSQGTLRLSITQAGPEVLSGPFTEPTSGAEGITDGE